MSTKNIVVFPSNRDFFGAKLVHIPLLFELKKKLAPQRLTVFTPYQNNQIFVGDGLADGAMYYRRSTMDLLKSLKQVRPDLVVNLRPESGTVLGALALLWGTPVYSLHTWSARLVSKKTSPNNTEIYRALNYLNLARLLVDIGETDDFFREYWGFNPQKSDQTTIALMVGAGTGEWKRWGIDNFLALISLILENHSRWKIEIVCGHQEKNYFPAIENYLDAHPNAPVIFHRDLPPNEIVKMLNHTTLVVGNDAGPTHLAQLCRVPFLSINSAHNEVVRNHITEWNRLDEKTKVILGEPGADIKEIKPALVYNEMMALLNVANQS